MKRSAGPFSEALASEIRSKRRAMFLTQEQLAALLNESAADLNIDRASISRWESGTRRPSLKHINVLVATLGISEEIAARAVNEPAVTGAAA